jgi:hypothetical protein
MRPLSLTQVAAMAGGRVHGAEVTIDVVATDTRALPAGAPLFVALKGERFDGHDHVATAAQGGAVAALVSRELDVALPQVIVADTERALAALAGAMQRERNTKVVAITGSNGKTSVKTLVLSILQRVAPTYANPGNRNNEIGLPLAVLAAPEDARFAIYEMGAGKPGDIAYLTAIARPDVALVNNIAPAHLERMGSLLGVADTKAAIYDALPADGVAVINADDAFAPYFAERAHGRRLIRFGLEASADVTARDIRSDGESSHFVLVAPQGEVEIALVMPGRHNVRRFPIIGSALLAVALYAFHFIKADTPLWQTSIVMMAFGVGLGFNFQPLTLAVQNAVSPRLIGVATSSATFTRQIGGTLGTAVFLSILFSTVPDKISAALTSASGTKEFQTALADPANAEFAKGLQSAAGQGGGAAAGVLKDSSFLNHLDPRLAKPFLQGFSDSMDLVFLVGAGVMVVGFLVMLLLPHVELRGGSAYSERGAADKADADKAEADRAEAEAAASPPVVGH